MGNESCGFMNTCLFKFATFLEAGGDTGICVRTTQSLRASSFEVCFSHLSAIF